MFHTLNQNQHYETRVASNYQLDFPPTCTTHYGTYSYRKKAAEARNEIQRMSIPDLLNCEFTDTTTLLQQILFLIFSQM